MNRLFMYVLVLLAVSTALVANDFKILSKSGKVTYKTGKKWSEIKVGNQLKASDQLKVEDKSYIVMLYIKSKKTLELKTPGTYDLKKIANEVSKKGSINSKLAKYFVDELSSTDEFFTKNNYKEGMEGNLAAVDRGIGFPAKTDTKVSEITYMNTKTSKTVSSLAGSILGSDAKMIQTRFPKTSFILDPNLKFEWYKYANNKEYSLKITDNTGKEYLNKSVKDTAIVIDLTQLNLVAGNNFYWRVESDGVSSLEECISVLNPEKSKEVEATINEILNESDSDSPMSKIAIASYLADCNISSTAYKYFKQALELAPDSEEYKRSFAKFLIRIGNFDEAKSIFATK